MTREQRIGNAETEIVNILRRLEEETGERVESIGLVEQDVTSMSDRAKTIATYVDIRLQPPTHRVWGP